MSALREASEKKERSATPAKTGAAQTMLTCRTRSSHRNCEDHQSPRTESRAARTNVPVTMSGASSVVASMVETGWLARL
jgi:hypothetical protein